MPSVKIRKTPSAYELFGGSFQGDTEPSSQRIRQQRSLGTFPRRGPQAQINAASEYRPRMRSNTTSGVSCSAQTPASYSRSRSRNRISEHILVPRSSSVAPPPLPSHGLPVVYGHGSIDRTVTMQGSQADIVIHTQTGNRTPGIVESVRSLERSYQFDASDVHHHDDIVDHLDAIDPQVATVSSLANTANAILIPPSQFYSRKPVIVLSSPNRRQRVQDTEAGYTHSESDDMDDMLDRHVESVLTRQDKVKRTLQGVWSFLKTPTGIIMGIYGFLVVFWGAALVLFLLKWINLHNANTQGFWVEVCSQIECGLFTATGIGLIPSRVLDTYRVSKIWYYKQKTTKLRHKAGLPELYDVDDLPDPAYDPNFVHVLTEQEEQDLHHHQVKFRESQTWYRPHGTVTHRAFPIKCVLPTGFTSAHINDERYSTALWICLFVDGNSFFQVILSSCMWSMNRFERPAWTTGTLIPASFLCGIISGVLIWRGGQRTRRTEKIEQILRMALAMEKKEKQGLSHGSTENASIHSPDTPLRLTSIACTDDLTTSSENNDNHGLIVASLGSPAIIEEMTIPATK
ncbi:hypothetical protein K503DRAFT_305794 [Rhizopogon vinicolor AM-OR11-026]|uniref:Uncharacterized protein n=1 Tax=Rhizopogon vinicolor AM-OR11-026 TaxID=1314800 RepID=A0A1B7NIF9_9AGAM|nr:hypothetical protein K503DRAFT_305794 [Rhizopogon vinicolor AM-OR11-026]